MDVKNHNTNRKKRVVRKRWNAAVLIALFVGILLTVFQYLGFVSKTVYEESVSHLTEIFHQSDNMLRELTDKNLNYLHMWGENLQDISNEDEIRNYIKKAQEDAGFLDFFFLSADGDYKMATGETGYLGLQENIEEVVKKIQEIEMTYSKGGQKEMPQMNFKLSDSQKFDALWSLLNPNYTEEGNWTIDYAICDVYDEYALAYSYENAQYERIYYTKNDETDSVALGEKVRVYVVDVTEKEKTTLDTLRDLNGGTYELVNENLEHAQENAEKISGFELKVTELENNIATLNTEKSAIQSSYELEHQKVESLTAENEGLKQYKLSIEAEQKNAVFTEYKDKLSEEILDTYREKAAEYSVADLDKELAYELKKTNFSFYEKKDNGYLRKDVQKNGIDEILARYVK